MKKIYRFLVLMFVVLLIALPVFSATDMMPSKNHAGYVGKDGKAWYKIYADYLYLTGGTGYEILFTGTPSANRTYTLPDKSGTIAMTSDVSTAAPAINAVTGAAADTTIAFTAYQFTGTSTLTNKDMFTFQGLGAFGDVSVMRIEQKTGNATDGTVLEVVSADANVDPLVVSSSAQAGVLTVGQAGTVDIIGATTITGAVTVTGAQTISSTLAVDGGVTLNSTLTTKGISTIGDNSSTVIINSSDWDISATGAATGMASVGFDDGTVIYHTTVACSNVCIKSLRAAPKELIAAPGAGKFIELVSAVLILNYGSEVLTESTDNLVIEYGTSGQDATAAIETTGFIDQAADQMAFILPQTIATVAAANVVNNNIRLFNTGDGEFAGNASANTTLSIRVAYRVHTSGL